MGGSTKQALLQALSAAEGAYISGQQLAEALGVSRAAVHKAAQTLSAQGYALDSAPRRGYRLAGGDPFCAEAVGPYPAPIHIYDTLQSSNLTAKQLGEKVVITVADDGEKIPAESVKHLFERFYRVESSRNKATGGTGLGLAIVQSIVGLHHGSVTARSDDQETAFVVTLPVKQVQKEVR